MKQTKKERTQKEIIEAAKDIIHDKGHEAVTVRYLAEVTGYSYTNLYYYFKDVNALLWTLRLDMIEDMIRSGLIMDIQITRPHIKIRRSNDAAGNVFSSQARRGRNFSLL